MTMPYPDLRHFTLRDYGNRVGVYRVLIFSMSIRFPEPLPSTGKWWKETLI